MKVISKFAIVLAMGVLVAAGSSNVFATCALPGSGWVSNYFDAPVGQSVAEAAGSFWGLGQYNPASPGGTDNGLIGPVDWLRYIPGAGFYTVGDWSSNLYDGCPQDPPNPQPARFGVQWTTSDGNDSYFAALCAGEDIFGAFPIVDIPGSPMSRVPKPVIHASSRLGTTTNLTVGTEPIPAVQNTNGCALAVTGFKIYTQTVPRNAPAPTGPASRNPIGGWTLLGQSAGGGDVAGGVNCAVDGDIYLLTTLVLDGNVEIGQGSRNSTKVECGPNLATPSGEGNEFRFIRKPKTAKGR
jgi:hypothetical protein